MSNKSAKEKKYEPIIFLNTPIKEEDKDAIGISSSVEMIRTAIKNDAKMIGIIAEYGAGKSSLTELLAKSKDYKRVVRINMWDTIASEDNNGKEISSLTKSFIYQLAGGISKKAANYVNKLLNNNYGIISFSVGYNRTWLFFALAVLSFALFLVGDNININYFAEIFGQNRRTIGMLLEWLAPIACVVGIALATLGIYFSSFVFSSWKESNKRQTGINEVFAAYSYVFDLLLGCRKPTLVIIDDLDRIEEKESIVGFLKELYRFNSLCSHKRKKRPVFLISIAPEANLKEKNKKIPVTSPTPNANESNEKWIYSKIFDFIVTLKPVHYDDYRNVISQIIENEPENKKKLNEILRDEEKIDNTNLPEAFKWLYKGKNLTLRELKERLNQAVALLIELKNKDYEGNPSISFATCVGVTYLGRTYPKEFYELLKMEEEFSKLIQNSYIWRNIEGGNSEKAIEERLNEQLDLGNINKDIAALICEGVIDTDFRMYFYAFPKGSYIKNLDEKDVCNYLEFPKAYPYEKNELNNKVDRLSEKEKLSTVYAIIERISKTNEIQYFPEVCFDNNLLWQKACEYNLEKAVNSYNNILNWEQKSYEVCCELLNKLADFNMEAQNTFWRDYLEKLFIDLALFKDEDIIKMRKALISKFPARVLELKKFFMDDNVPIISKQEIDMISNPNISVLLVNKNKIDDNSYEYIQTQVLATRLEETVLGEALSIQKEMLQKQPFEVLLRGTYDFLYANYIIDDKIFCELCDAVKKGVLEKSKVCKYINILSTDSLTDTYLKKINELCFFEGLKKDALLRLIKNKLYTASLLEKQSTEIGNNINVFAEYEISAVLEACEIINKDFPEAISKIRRELVRLNNGQPHERYEELYLNDYQIITVLELSEINKFEDGIRLVDASKFTTENIGCYAEFVSSEIHMHKECFYIFDWFFNTKYNNICSDSEVISLFLEKLDFSKIIFSSMSEEDIKSVVEIMRKPLELSKLESAKAFMKNVKCLIHEFELRMVQTMNLDTYISFVNEVNLVSDYTIEKILNIQPKFKLNHAITERLLELSEYKHYAVGKILFEEKLEFPMIGVPEEELLALYSENSLIMNYFIGNSDFLDAVMERNLYRKFVKPCTKVMLEPFMKMRQTYDFVKFVLETLDENAIKSYLRTLNEIKEERDSIAISRILTTAKYVKYLADKETFRHIKFRLWDNVKTRTGYKSAFTKKRNAYVEHL